MNTYYEQVQRGLKPESILDHAKIVAVMAEKGGVGKTTVATNLATLLARDNKVLLIDCDEQCNACFDLGMSMTDMISLYKAKRTVADVIEGQHENIRDYIINITRINDTYEEIRNLDILPSSFYLMYTERKLIVRSRHWVDVSGNTRRPEYEEAMELQKVFEKNREFLDGYDYIFIDTKPSLSAINECVLKIANSLLVVTEPSYNSMFGIETLFGFWDQVMSGFGTDRKVDCCYSENVILNRYQKDRSLDREIEKVLRGDFDERIPDFAKETFVGYKDIYVPVPVKESAYVKRGSTNAKPMCVRPNLFEREYIEEVWEPLIAELKKRGAL